MNRLTTPLTADLARAGRALSQVSVKTIAEAAGLDKERVRDFEKRGIALDETSNDSLRAALEDYGVVFFAEDSEAGYGVRRKYTSSKVRQLERWETEGGPAYEDDI